MKKKDKKKDLCVDGNHHNFAQLNDHMDSSLRIFCTRCGKVEIVRK